MPPPFSRVVLGGAGSRLSPRTPGVLRTLAATAPLGLQSKYVGGCFLIGIYT